MGYTDGVLKPLYEVHCRGCERPMLGLSQHRAEAVTLLEGYGWRRVGGKWFCNDCCDNRSRDQLMTIARWTP